MEDAVIGRVRQIIEKTGERQQDVAKRIGIDPSKLTKSLNGQRRFTSLELALLAQLGGQTIDWLLTGRPHRTWTFAHRLSVLDEGTVDRYGEETVRSIARYHDGLKALGFLPGSKIDSSPPVDTSSFVESGNRLAEWATSQLSSPVLGLETAQLISQIEQVFGVDVTITELPVGCDGFSYSDGDLKAIVLATSSNSARQRYTLAHELGHLLAGDAEDHIVSDTLGLPGGYIESRANVFAASFLAPAEEVRSAVHQTSGSLKETAWRFGVSPTAFSWRLLNLELIDTVGREELARQSTRQIAHEIGRSEEQLERDRLSLVSRPPMRLLVGYLKAFQQGQASLHPVASMLGMELDDVYDIFAANVADVPAGNPEQE